MTAPDLGRITATARRAAAAAGHAFVGTEHLLAASLLEPHNPLRDVLREAAVAPEELAEELLAGLPAAEAGAEAAAPPPLSRFAERALEEARQPGGNLLAVLLRAPKGRMASVLGKRRLDLGKLRAAAEPAEQAAPAVERGGRAVGRSGGQAKASRANKTNKAIRTDRAVSRPPARPSAQPPRERRLPPHLEPGARPRRSRVFGWGMLLLLAVPASVVVRWQRADPLLIFALAAIGMIPLAGILGKATEHLAERSGAMVGGLLNATFGNAAELIIALVALRAGMVELVKASITGSILGNLLLILGLAFVAGGLRNPILRFNRTAAGMAAAMLALAVGGLVFPALFHLLHPGTVAERIGPSELRLTEAVAIILALTYLASLWFSLKTHRSVFAVEHGALPPAGLWKVRTAVLVLAAATAAVVVESEILVASIEPVMRRVGISETVLGLILIPLIGNAAEHGAAVTVARAGKIDLSLQIALGSSTQIALLVAPLLVFAGLATGHPMSLLFTPLELVAVGIATGVVALITLDGESHWLEGVQLLALYGMIVAAAFFL
ncbi:MAG: calcium/proton exchanger [Gemmatimonadales bacterium]